MQHGRRLNRVLVRRLASIVAWQHEERHDDARQQPVVADVMRGVNAYGQTDSGKTHSLQCADADDAGLLPRVVVTLFVHATIDATHQYSIEAAAVLHRRSYDRPCAGLHCY